MLAQIQLTKALVFLDRPQQESVIVSCANLLAHNYNVCGGCEVSKPFTQVF